jgi:tungstate transport system ATP-binding protein
MNNPAPFVALRQASVRFGDVMALRDVSFAVHPGERIALVGSNGSGKTTLLRTLHGQLHRALVDANSWQSAQPVAQAMVFQRPFMLGVSVWRNLHIALWLAGVPKAERARRADEALARVKLLDQKMRAARTLSGGQQQRLAMARAWAVRPQLLFLDEPTASLDPNAKRDVENLIETFAAEGMTVVMSTHNLGQAKRLATRVAYLEAGQVVCDLSTEAFFLGQLPPQADAFVRGELA